MRAILFCSTVGGATSRRVRNQPPHRLPPHRFKSGPRHTRFPFRPHRHLLASPSSKPHPGDSIIKRSRTAKARRGSCDANPSPPLNVAPMRSLPLLTCPAITGIIAVQSIIHIARISQVHIDDSHHRSRFPTNRRSGHDNLLGNNSLRQQNKHEIILYINILTHAIIHATLGSITTTSAVWVFPAAK